MRKKNILENSSSYILIRECCARIRYVASSILHAIYYNHLMNVLCRHTCIQYIYLNTFRYIVQAQKMAGLLQSTTHCPPRLRYFLYWRTLASLILGGTWKEMGTLRLQRPLVLHLFRVWDLSLRQNNLRY